MSSEFVSCPELLVRVVERTCSSEMIAFGSMAISDCCLLVKNQIFFTNTSVLE